MPFKGQSNDYVEESRNDESGTMKLGETSFVFLPTSDLCRLSSFVEFCRVGYYGAAYG